MEPPDLQTILEDLASAAIAAGAHALARRPDVLAGHTRIERKYGELACETHRDVVHATVTAVDAESQEIFLRAVHARYPHWSCSVEENTRPEDQSETQRAMLAAGGPGSPEHVVVLDALDGTANYALKLGGEDCDWAVCCGYSRQRQMQVAIIYFPETTEIFWALRGRGAFAGHVTDGRPGWAQARAIHVARREGPVQLDLRHWQYLRELGLESDSLDTNLTCTARELCEIADGRGGQYLSGSLTKWVDAGVGRLIVHEAGGVSADLSGHPIALEPADEIQPNGERLALFVGGLVITAMRAELESVIALIQDARRRNRVPRIGPDT